MDEWQPIVNYPPRAGLWWRGVFFAAGAGVCGWLTTQNGPGWRFDFPLVLAGGLAAVCSWSFLSRVMSRRPLLVVDEEGVRSSYGTPFRLRWSEVDEFFGFRVKSASFLGVRPRDVRGELRRLPIRRRPLAWLNWKLFGSPFFVPEMGFPVPLQEFLEHLEDMRRRLGAGDAAALDNEPSR